MSETTLPELMTEHAVLTSFEGKRVKVFLADRNIALNGVLSGHDTNTISLSDNFGVTMVYKSRVISITEAEHA